MKLKRRLFMCALMTLASVGLAQVETREASDRSRQLIVLHLNSGTSAGLVSQQGLGSPLEELKVRIEIEDAHVADDDGLKFALVLVNTSNRSITLRHVMDNLWFEVIDATASMRVTLHRSPFHDIGPSSASAYEQSMREDRSLKPTRALRNDIPFPIDEIYREHLTLEAMETVEISFTITAIRNPAVLKSRAGIVSVVDGEGIVPPPGRYRLMFVFIGRIQNDGRLAQKLFRLNPKSISQKHIDAGIMMRGGFVRVEIR